MTDATLTSKGQVTIPAEIRRASNLQAGDRLSFTPMPDGTVLLRAKTRRPDEVGGLLRKTGRGPLPVEQLGLGAPSGNTVRRARR